MAKWVMNFDDPKVGGRAALALTRTRGVLTDGKTIPYAFGIELGEYRGLATEEHGGGRAGFATDVLHAPMTFTHENGRTTLAYRDMHRPRLPETSAPPDQPLTRIVFAPSSQRTAARRKYDSFAM